MKLSKKSESTIKFLLKTNEDKKSKFPNINSIIKSFHKEIIISEKHVKLIIPTIKKKI